MGIRPYVAIRQDLEESGAPILESQMKGMLVGPCVQVENDFSDKLNVSSVYGTIAGIIADASVEPKIIEAQGVSDGAVVDFTTLEFGGTGVIAKIDIADTYVGTVKSSDEKYIVKIRQTEDTDVSKQTLLEKGCAAGDYLDITVDNNGTPETERIKIRSFEVVVNDDSTEELYIYLWDEIQNDLVTDETVEFTLIEYKPVDEAHIYPLGSIEVSQYGNSPTAYSIDNTLSPEDGGFGVNMYVYLPTTAPEGVTFDNREISLVEINNIANYTRVDNVYWVTDGDLYNFFEAQRVDLSNNIIEVTTENYEDKLGLAVPKNKVSYAMKLISAEVPGATMKVYVTESDSSDAYIKALNTIATSPDFYSVTSLTDSESVIGGMVSMVKAAAEESVAKWKMAIVAPKIPYLGEKYTTDNYTITAVAEGSDEYYIETTEGGFLSSDIRVGDYVFGSDDIDAADEIYYEQPGEPYSDKSKAIIESVITDKKILVKVVIPGADIVTEMSGQDLVIGALNTNDALSDAVKTKAKQIANHGVVTMFPDKFEVIINDINTLIPGYMASAVVNAIMAHLPPQQGLSNLAINSFTKVIGSSFYFTDGELDEIATEGVFVIIQQNYSSKPYVLRQLTTDMSSLEAMEINKVRCLDYATLAFASGLDDYIGKRNVTDRNIDDIRRGLDTTGKYLVEETVQPYLGSILTSYEILDVYSPEGEEDAISAIIDVTTPTSLNKIRLYVSSGK